MIFLSTNIVQSQVLSTTRIDTLSTVQFSKEQADSLCTDLEKRYKRDEKYGIPAEWFIGEVKLLFCPKNLFGKIVSKEGYVLIIKRGNIIEQKAVNLKEGALESSSHPQEDGSVLVRGDGCWWSDIAINTDSLNHFVNRNQSETFKKKAEKEFSILLVTDSSSGMMHFYSLLPPTLDVEDKMNIAHLKERLELLTAWSYGPLLTLDGRFMYGRYFKATSSNGKWKLQDYISSQN